MIVEVVVKGELFNSLNRKWMMFCSLNFKITMRMWFSNVTKKAKIRKHLSVISRDHSSEYYFCYISVELLQNNESEVFWVIEFFF